MFAVPASFVAAGAQLRGSPAQRILWACVLFLFFLLVGFRHEVGGDWYNYLRHFDSARAFGVVHLVDPGYVALNLGIAKLGLSVHWVNAACAVASVGGVSRFCRAQPQPWLALLIAVPYVLVVVAMGYTRQSVALGCLMAGLTALSNGHVVRYVAFVLFGALFHIWVVLVLPLFVFRGSRRNWGRAAIGLMIALMGVSYFVQPQLDSTWTNYVDAGLRSAGGLVRLGISGVAAILFLLFSRRLTTNEAERALWRVIALGSLVMLPLGILASTAADRFAIYLLPIQMLVFSRIAMLGKGPTDRYLINFSVVVVYGLVLFVWLEYANHSYAWTPYQNHFY